MVAHVSELGALLNGLESEFREIELGWSRRSQNIQDLDADAVGSRSKE